METQTIASGALASTAPPARTQKARGIAALARCQSSNLVPPFQVYPANQVGPSQLIGYFSRPCPMRPRHGFVNSRIISNEQQGETLIQQTLAADPDAEIVTMPLVQAAFSGIWTRGALTVGMGHDGATSGSSAWSLPALGDFVAHAVLEEAGVLESPYVEILWPAGDPSYRLVQLRDGPQLPLTVDFIPERIRVERVLLAVGDLLQWEDKMQNIEHGTVVYHPNGSLASHYAVHAVLNRVPLLTSRVPSIGEWLEPEGDTVHEPDIDALRAGFHLALGLNVSYEKAAHVMLAGCHHASVWTGKHDDLLGLALGFAYRLSIAAALGEMRHVPGSYKHRDEIEDRDDVYDACWGRMHAADTRRRYEAALTSFHALTWMRGYGGAKWFYFASWAAQLHNHLALGNARHALEALNQLVHCAHNGGWAFNKFLPEEALSQTARNPMSSLVLCAPLFYRAHTFLRQHQDGLARRFRRAAVLVRVPKGEPNFEVTDEDDGEDDWTEERSGDEPDRRRKLRLGGRGVRIRPLNLRRLLATTEDIPF